jgi:hypothetical protein
VDEMVCANADCRGVVLKDDQFCGACGTPRAELPAPGTFTGDTFHGSGENGRNSSNGGPAGNGKIPSPPIGGGLLGSPDTTPPEEPAGEPFFSHEFPRPSGPLNNVTRSLCAAAYLDRGFANKVISNLLVTRRAVAPSVNFDAGPVLRHCLRARRHILIRDTVLTLIVLVGLVVKTLPTLDVLLFTFVLGGLLPSLGRRRGKFRTHLLLLLAAMVAGVLAVVFTVALLLGSFVSSVFSATSVLAGPASLLGTFVVLVGALTATEFVYLYTTAQALLAGSRQGVQSHRPLSRIAEQRMAVVEGAQWGNITLHSGWFPFIGAGAQTQTHWSIATPLRTSTASNQGGENPLSGGRYVRIDPVDLHRFVGDRLRALNDPALPNNERIAALAVSHRLVGTGWLSAGNPLMDRRLSTPYSHASQDAVEALIRHPQARLRYYQQVSVNDESPIVMSHGREVIGDLDQEVAVSAFVYAAVEGRMLYLQFVLTALPPIDGKYRINRTLYATSVSRTLIFTCKRLFSSIVSAVPGICGAFRLWRNERQLEKRYLSAAFADYGAQISVRELGTAGGFSRYIQELDVEKYNMIFSQVLLNAVTEYLGKMGIDTSAFTGIAQNIINNINNGNVYGDLNQQAGNNNSVNKPSNPNSGP